MRTTTGSRPGPPDQLALPESLREVLIGRITASGSHVERFLELAAVAGERFDPVLLMQVDDLGGRLADALDRAVVVRLVEQVGSSNEYRFIHALVRAAVLERLSTVRRVRLHDQLAERLERMGTTQASFLAYHAAASAMLGPAQAGRATRSARRAGDDAMSAFAYLSAVGWYETVLEHLPASGLDAPETRVQALLSLGVAQRSAAIPAFRQTLLDAAALAHDAGLTPVPRSRPRSPTREGRSPTPTVSTTSASRRCAPRSRWSLTAITSIAPASWVSWPWSSALAPASTSAGR